MPKPYIYTEGEPVGKYGATFIQEIDPYVSPQGKKTRRAIFKCGFCGTAFMATIPNVKNNATKSCGCLLAKNIRKKAAKKFLEKRFGKLIVTEQVVIDNTIMYKCHCDCGNNTIVKGGNLTSGNTRSCGCLEQEILDQKYFIDLTGKTYGKLTVIEYVGKNKNNRFWKCRCDCGNTVIRTQSAIMSGHSSCGCQMSIGETVISSLLSKKGIDFLREYSFENCVNPKTNRKLRFDFYLPDYNTCIEFDGKQHFQSKGSFAELESLEDIQYRDKIKSDYCINHDILLIRIPFSQINNIDIEDILSIIEHNTERFMVSYNPMITRMLEAFDRYDNERMA